MTEEIIDGVDVSGCIYKKDGIADCGMFADGEFRCEGQICLYKQVLRLETENKKLKEENFKLGQINIKKVTLVENRQLEAENTKLKKALDEIKEVFKKYDSEEEGTVAELLHDVFEVYGRVCEVLKDE